MQNFIASLHKVLFELSCKGVSQKPQWIDH